MSRDIFQNTVDQIDLYHKNRYDTCQSMGKLFLNELSNPNSLLVKKITEKIGTRESVSFYLKPSEIPGSLLSCYEFMHNNCRDIPDSYKNEINQASKYLKCNGIDFASDFCFRFNKDGI